jgi:T-complex protein 1 subunit beta
MHMSLAVEELAKTTKGKEGLAVEAFAKALRALPTIICDNAGYDSAELVQNLRTEISKGNASAGLDMNNGAIYDMGEQGINECYKVKEQALHSAAEAAEMILRVDEIVRCAPRQREG